MLKRIFKNKSTHALSVIYIKQVGATTVIRFISVLVSLAYVPIVLGYLDQEKYGVWITLTTIVNWIHLLDVGMGNGMRNKLAEAIAKGQVEKGKVFVSTTYGILGSIFLGVMVLFFLINPQLNWQNILKTTLLTPDELLMLTNVAVSLILIRFIVQTISLVYAAHGNTAMGGFLQLIISITTLIFVYLATIFTQEGNIVLLAWIITGIPVLVYGLFSFYSFYFKYPLLRPTFRFIKIKESGNLLKLSAQFFLVQITATILYASIPFIVTRLFGPGEVTVFHIANSIFNLPIMIMGLLTAPILPLVTQAYAQKDVDWLLKMLKRQIMVSVIISLGTILMMLLSPQIYSLWIGDKVQIPFYLSISIGIYSILKTINMPFSAFINGIGKIKAVVLMGPFEVITFIGLSILFSKRIEDVTAISIALIFTSVIALIVIPMEIRKQLKGLKN